MYVCLCRCLLDYLTVTGLHPRPGPAFACLSILICSKHTHTDDYKRLLTEETESRAVDKVAKDLL